MLLLLDRLPWSPVFHIEVTLRSSVVQFLFHSDLCSFCKINKVAKIIYKCEIYLSIFSLLDLILRELGLWHCCACLDNEHSCLSILVITSKQIIPN